MNAPVNAPVSAPVNAKSRTRPRLVLLDRDGVLNEDRPDHVRSPEELVMIPGAAAAAGRLARAGCALAVVTNQSGLGRGYFTAATLQAIHAKLRRALEAEGARIDAFYIAPDPPWAPTARRKPGPGMILEALEQFGAAPAEAVMIGDALRDLQAAAATDVARILVRTGKGRATEEAGWPDALNPVTVLDDLAAAADALLAS